MAKMKMIELTEKQYLQLRRWETEIGMVHRTTKRLLKDLMDHLHDEERLFWDKIAVLTGYRDYYDAIDHGVLLSIEWPCKSIRVTEEDEGGATETVAP